MSRLEPKKVRAIDAWYWADSNKIKLVAGPFTTEDHDFQIEMLQLTPRREAQKKATQMTFTETQVLKNLHGMINGKYPAGVLYMFPTADDVSDFSSSRFKPLIKDNPTTIGRYVRDTDRTNLKRIGQGFLYFRGARLTQVIEGQKKAASKLKSIPVDKIVLDELDEMTPEAIPLAKGRMKHSRIQEEVYLANPTIPDYGIDKLYNESDQRVWMIKCAKCGKETCLEIEFPDCLERLKDGTVKRICVHCRDSEIFPRDGHWVPQVPSKTEHMVGRWISHLNSSFVDPREVLGNFENPETDKTEFYNLELGMAHIDAESRLTKNQVYACCRLDPMPYGSTMQCAMGVDVGKLLHVVIGYKVNDYTAKVVKLARVPSFNDVHDLAKRFNVQCAVFDLYPETRKVRNFRDNEEFAVFGCDYLDQQKGPAKWNYKGGLVSVDRTEICDRTHKLVVNEGKLELPRKNTEIKEYAAEMINIAKVLEEDKATGRKVYRYRKLGTDHYRHATNYFRLALGKVGISYEQDRDEYDQYEEESAGEGRCGQTGY